MAKTKQVGEFHTREPEQLDRELTEMQGNLATAIDAVSAAQDKPLTIGFPVTANQQTAIANKLTRVDTSFGNVELFLPRAAEGTGKVFPVAKAVAANTLTIRPLDGPINNSGSLALTSPGLKWIVGDGTGYWAT